MNSSSNSHLCLCWSSLSTLAHTQRCISSTFVLASVLHTVQMCSDIYLGCVLKHLSYCLTEKMKTLVLVCRAFNTCICSTFLWAFTQFNEKHIFKIVYVLLVCNTICCVNVWCIKYDCMNREHNCSTRVWFSTAALFLILFLLIGRIKVLSCWAALCCSLKTTIINHSSFHCWNIDSFPNIFSLLLSITNPSAFNAWDLPSAKALPIWQCSAYSGRNFP